MADLKALLDTNIIIHRENNILTNESIGLLCWWLDNLDYKKCIHQCSIDEIKKYKDEKYLELLNVKLDSYELLSKYSEPDNAFLQRIIKEFPIKNENDIVDNQLLYEVYNGRIDVLITEDGNLIKKSVLVGIDNKVLSINDFIERCKKENPKLKDYKFNSITKEKFGNIKLNDKFFDSLKEKYSGFDKWYIKKSDEYAYVHYNVEKQLTGFLYIKTENTKENYSDIVPSFEPKLRLKIGTFKVLSTGYRLGERFLQIIFDYATECNVDEIYVTMYDDTLELKNLKRLLEEWGFEYYGLKKGKELVLTKKMKGFDADKTIKQNYPNINYHVSKRFLPILPQYHTRLFPDSILFTERNKKFADFLGYRYALEKCYISFSYKKDFNVGDIVLIYRCAYADEIKAYKSVVTSICVINEIKRDIISKEQMLQICKNRSVFNDEELNYIWGRGRNSIQIIKMLYIRPFESKVILKSLRDFGIIGAYSGPRPFDEISDEQFDIIIANSNTKLYRYEQ